MDSINKNNFISTHKFMDHEQTKTQDQIIEQKSMPRPNNNPVQTQKTIKPKVCIAAVRVK